MLIVLGVLGSIIGLWDAVNRINEGHENLDVNEFASIKNSSHHELHTPNPITSVSKLNNLTVSVLSTIVTAQGKFDAITKPPESVAQQSNVSISDNQITAEDKDDMQKDNTLFSTSSIKTFNISIAKGNDDLIINISTSPDTTRRIDKEPLVTNDTFLEEVALGPSIPTKVSSGGSVASGLDAKPPPTNTKVKDSAQQTITQRNIDTEHIEKSSLSPQKNTEKSSAKPPPLATFQNSKATKT